MPKIHDLDVEEYLYESVSIDRSRINDEFARVSADLAYWGERYAQAERTHAEAKATLERTQGEEYRRQRAFLEANADGKITEAMVNSHVLSAKGYRAAKEDLVDSSSAVTRLKGVLEAIKTKRDMLVSLGAQMRAESRGEPYIRDENDDADEPDWGYNNGK